MNTDGMPHDGDKIKPADKPVDKLARWLLPSFGGLSLLGVLALMVQSKWRFLTDSDTGWHIRTGDLMRQTGAIPRTDSFSFTLPGREWFAWEWLTDWLMSLLHQAHGLGGVVAAAYFVLLAAYALLYRLMLRRGADPMVAIVVMLATALCSMVHWLARPHLLSILLLVAWYGLVESYRRNRTRWIWCVPPLIALWANLHGAFSVTFVLLGVYAAGEWLEYAQRGAGRGREVRQVLRTYALVGGLTFAAGLLTPYGFKLYGHLFRYLNDTTLLKSVQEFQSPNFHNADGKLIEVLLLCGTVAAVNALRQRRFVEPLLFVLWAHMTLQSERHVTLAAVTLAPIIAEQWSLLLREWAAFVPVAGGRFAARWLRFRRWRAGMIAIDRQMNDVGVYAGLIVFFLVLVNSAGLTNKLLVTQFAAKEFPVAAAEFIAREQPAGNLYAHDQFGGYLIYRFHPQVKVFVDGRSDFYRQGQVLDDFEALAAVKPTWAELLDKYNIGWMVLRRDEALAVTALTSGKWTNVHQDATAQVLVRTTVAETMSRAHLKSESAAGRALSATQVVR